MKRGNGGFDWEVFGSHWLQPPAEQSIAHHFFHNKLANENCHGNFDLYKTSINLNFIYISNKNHKFHEQFNPNPVQSHTIESWHIQLNYYIKNHLILQKNS